MISFKLLLSLKFWQLLNLCGYSKKYCLSHKDHNYNLFVKKKYIYTYILRIDKYHKLSSLEKSKRGAGIGLLSFDFPSKPTLAMFHRHNAREIYRGHRSLPVLSHCVWKTLTSLTVALVSKLSRNRLNSTEREKERERENPILLPLLYLSK